MVVLHRFPVDVVAPCSGGWCRCDFRASPAPVGCYRNQVSKSCAPVLVGVPVIPDMSPGSAPMPCYDANISQAYTLVIVRVWRPGMNPSPTVREAPAVGEVILCASAEIRRSSNIFSRILFAIAIRVVWWVRPGNLYDAARHSDRGTDRGECTQHSESADQH